jgi:hypothetical protein
VSTPTGFFVPHHFYAIDMGVSLVLGIDTLAVYDILRRYTWRSEHKGGRLASYFRDGKLVCSVSQPKVAEMIGRKVRHTAALFAALREHEWIKPLGPVAHDSSIGVYQLGKLVSSDGTKKRGTHEVFFGDEWILDAHRAMLRHFQTRAKDTSIELADASEVPDRVAFLRAWAGAESRRSGSKVPRATVEDPSSDDEALGNDSAARGDAQSAAH